MAGIKDLMRAVHGDPYFAAVLNTEDHPEVPAIAYDNKLLALILKEDPRYSETNIGANAEAYLDPRYETGLTPFNLRVNESSTAAGEYYPKYDAERNTADRVWASVRDTPTNFVDTLAHENIHANSLEGPAREEAAQNRLLGHSPYLNRELMSVEHEKLPRPLTEEERLDASQSVREPVAYIGAREALLPSGQMPIQEEMNRRGLGALYAHLTTPGPVATRWTPSVMEALKAYLGPDEDTLQHHGPSVMKRVQNYIENKNGAEEPYELEGNPKKGKKNGGSVAAIVAHNQKLRARRRR